MSMPVCKEGSRVAAYGLKPSKLSVCRVSRAVASVYSRTAKVIRRGFKVIVMPEHILLLQRCAVCITCIGVASSLHISTQVQGFTFLTLPVQGTLSLDFSVERFSTQV